MSCSCFTQKAEELHKHYRKIHKRDAYVTLDCCNKSKQQTPQLPPLPARASPRSAQSGLTICLSACTKQQYRKGSSYHTLIAISHSSSSATYFGTVGFLGSSVQRPGIPKPPEASICHFINKAAFVPCTLKIFPWHVSDLKFKHDNM